ncbi:thiamine pyrophosphate-dependent enzyme, partial [Priestia megaterium]|uniref:thiamine pyrophosphate-dependent enzyme n=1 Tax=Priestia megaterium TaxID=1404 RepID=UPI000C014776
QRETEAEPRFNASQELPDFPFAAYAELLGLKGVSVDDPAQLGAAWEDVLSADRPAVLEVLTDPNTPLLPPFPAGEQKLEGMQSALEEEGSDGAHAR